jgi:hypothetical protein
MQSSFMAKLNGSVTYQYLQHFLAMHWLEKQIRKTIELATTSTTIAVRRSNEMSFKSLIFKNDARALGWISFKNF